MEQKTILFKAKAPGIHSDYLPLMRIAYSFDSLRLFPNMSFYCPNKNRDLPERDCLQWFWSGYVDQYLTSRNIQLTRECEKDRYFSMLENFFKAILYVESCRVYLSYLPPNQQPIAVGFVEDWPKYNEMKRQIEETLGTAQFRNAPTLYSDKACEAFDEKTKQEVESQMLTMFSEFDRQVSAIPAIFAKQKAQEELKRDLRIGKPSNLIRLAFFTVIFLGLGVGLWAMALYMPPFVGLAVAMVLSSIVASFLLVVLPEVIGSFALVIGALFLLALCVGCIQMLINCGKGLDAATPSDDSPSRIYAELLESGDEGEEEKKRELIDQDPQEKNQNGALFSEEQEQDGYVLGEEQNGSVYEEETEGDSSFTYGNQVK